MNTYYNKLKDAGKGLWAIINSKIFLLILVVLGGLYAANLFVDVDNLKRDAIINEQNQTALTDSLVTSHNEKTGEMSASIAGFISTEADLKKLSKDLSDKVDDQDGKIVSLTSTVFTLTQTKEQLEGYLDKANAKFDNIQQINDSTHAIPWELPYRYDSTNFDIFKGITTFEYGADSQGMIFTNKGTVLTDRITQISLSYGQSIVDDKLRIFVTSKYPGFTVKSMEGVFIDPTTNPYIKKLIKKPRWFTGFSAGVSLIPQYTNGSVKFILGPSIHFSIYKF